MKFIHLSDLHLGKRVNEYSMLEDQEYILKKIINIVDAEKPDGVIIAGDVYDKSVPAAEAVQLFDNFLVQLAKRKLEVFVISGNHDSPENSLRTEIDPETIPVAKKILQLLQKDSEQYSAFMESIS